MVNQHQWHRLPWSGMLCGGVLVVLCATAAAEQAPATQPTVTNVSAPAAPLDFAAEAQLLFRVGACATTAPIPKHLPAAFVRSHCRHMRALQRRFTDRWMSKARPFFARTVPPDLPAVRCLSVRWG